MHVQTMSLREFDDAQTRMPPGLAERTQPLRACATRAAWCPCCGVARRLLWLCFAAVRYGDDPIAELLVTEAEHYVAGGRHPATCPHLPPRPAGARAPVQGQVPGWSGAPGPLVAATDASWKRGTCGLGYVVGDGRWGMRGWTFGPQDPTGPSRVLVSELRAVSLLLDRVEQGRVEDGRVEDGRVEDGRVEDGRVEDGRVEDGRVEDGRVEDGRVEDGRVEDDRDLLLLVDSLPALRFLRAWRHGDTSLLPDGYDPRPRRYGTPPSLVRLARRVAGHPGLRLEHVKGHSGHPLNETADSLASIARRRVTERFDSTACAEGLVEAFLRAWHDTCGLAA